MHPNRCVAEHLSLQHEKQNQNGGQRTQRPNDPNTPTNGTDAEAERVMDRFGSDESIMSGECELIRMMMRRPTAG